MSDHRGMPWHKWYPADYLADRGLSACSIETEGAWARTLNHMMHDGNGTLADTLEGWGHLWRVTEEKAAEIVAELKRYKIGTVGLMGIDGEEVVLTSRRVTEDLAARRAGTDRVRKYRAKQKASPPATPKAKDGPDPLPLSDWRGVLDMETAAWLARVGAEWKRTVHPTSNDPTVGSDDVTRIVRNMDRRGPLDVEGIERAIANAAKEYTDRPESMRPMLKKFLQSGDWRDFARADWKPSKAATEEHEQEDGKVKAAIHALWTKEDKTQEETADGT